MARSDRAWIRYEVIRVWWCWFRVDRVSNSSFRGIYRNELNWFISQSRAEACAKGLAEGTWTLWGPIMASYDTYAEPEEINNDALPL